MQTGSQLLDLHRQLMSWWRHAGRVLPWREKMLPNHPAPQSASPAEAFPSLSTLPILRETVFHSYFAAELPRDPYRVIVAEVMLQQTQVDRVLPKYRAWMEQWPTVQHLADVELADVLKFWQGLGYNRRARFLWLLAREIVQTHQGIWPQTEAELLQLPGVGKYTARAVLSFAFGQQVAVVDTNVKRVLSRLLDGMVQPYRSEKDWFAFAEQQLPPGQADVWNQLLMDLGALICTAKSPTCDLCPVSQLCLAQQQALAAGAKNYADMLSKQDRPLSLPGRRFQDSDRFFRGRMIDLLRIAPHTEKQLWQKLHIDFGLLDQQRYEKLIAGLEKEKLLTRTKQKLHLG